MYINENSKVVVQGITGNQGMFHTKLMLDYGTKIVAGVTPGKDGQIVHGIPVFNDVQSAVKETRCNTSIIFVPARFTFGAVEESLLAGIIITCIITENVPVFDMLRLFELAKERKLHLMGPNCPGMLIPDKIKLGIMPGDMCHFGKVAVIAKSGTLSYEITKAIGNAGIGVSAYIGIGGDPVRGKTMVEAVEYYSKDSKTKTIVLIGEIGSDEEEKTAKFIKENVSKPVIAYIAGKSAPEGKRMGHAGAIISGDFGTAQGKINALKNAGVFIADLPWDIPQIIKKV
ncbi:MAG: Succinyl-CoA ligase [ADP-forming] subunit alpha [Candidatus Lokiarchaeum sp. GC14_75]|nr:MAG: Succinyl-CoA ligase [ADP-forming] subunit alpha [Candidatus Lokiarchaeum sp. GC14_75]